MNINFSGVYQLSFKEKDVKAEVSFSDKASITSRLARHKDRVEIVAGEYMVGDDHFIAVDDGKGNHATEYRALTEDLHEVMICFPPTDEEGQAVNDRMEQENQRKRTELKKVTEQFVKDNPPEQVEVEFKRTGSLFNPYEFVNNPFEKK